MSKTTPKKQRWSESLPTPKYDDGLLIGAANHLALALFAGEMGEADDKNVLADGAAAEIRAYRKSLKVDSEREEVPTLYLDEWETTGDNALWQALRDVSLAAIWSDDCSGFPAHRVAEVLRGAEAFLREHWKQRPEKQAHTEIPITNTHRLSLRERVWVSE